MPTPTSNPQRDPRTSTESYGQGQSGYASGRVGADPSLPLQGRNSSPVIPEHERLSFADDEPTQEVLADDRFGGAGGVPWAPEDRLDRDPAEMREDEERDEVRVNERDDERDDEVLVGEDAPPAANRS